MLAQRVLRAEQALLPARLGTQRPRPLPLALGRPLLSVLALQPLARQQHQQQQQRSQTTQSQQRSPQRGLNHAAAARNMSPPAQLTRPGQSQRRPVASHTAGRPTPAGSAAPPAPPPPRARSDYSSAAPAAISLPSAARINPSTAQLRPSSVSRTAQIAGHLQSQHARSYTTTSTMASPYSVRKIAAPNTLEHRVYIEKDGVPVSPFHDIPLYANQERTILNMIVEIPRWTNAKLEVRLDCLPVRCRFVSRMLTPPAPDLQGRAPQPHQAGHQEGQAPLRPQLLPPQGLPVELRCLPPGMYCLHTNRSAGDRFG